MNRVCTACDQAKPQTTEHYYWYEKRGWFGRCKPCVRAQQRAQNARKRAEKPRKPARKLLDNAGNAWCSGHGAWLPVSAFNRSSSTRHGLQYRCRDCDRAYKRERLRDPVNLERQRERIRQADRRRRAAHWAVTPLANGYQRVREAGGHAEKVTPETLLAHWAEYGVSEHECWACGAPWEHGSSGHLDHVVPVADGGSHAPLNLRPLCQPCSLGKRSDPLMLWVQAAPRMFLRFIARRAPELNGRTTDAHRFTCA